MSYKEIFTGLYENYGFGSLESRSGPGSTLEQTKDLRNQILDMVKERDIKTVVDIPCGDFNWMKHIVFNFDSYIGGDIVSQCVKENNEKYGNSKIKFIDHDILNDEIPSGDLLIVRDIIGHFPITDGKKIVENVLKSNCKYLLSTTWYNVIDKTYHNKHNNRGAEYGRFYPVNLMSEPFNFPEPDAFIIEDVMVEDHDKGNRKVLGLWNLETIKNNKPPDIIDNTDIIDNADIIDEDLTVVTGLWNIGRTGRDFDHYIECFKKFLDIPNKMFIYIPEEYEYLVWEKRSGENTYVKIASLEYLKTLYNPFWDKTQSIRTDPNWYNMTGEHGWLKDSPQASLEYYNVIVQSKMFLLNDATLWNPFNSEYFIWLDAGITNTVNSDLLIQKRALDKIVPHLNSFLFLSYPYQTHTEIHGFDYKGMMKYTGEEVKYVCRGGLFGGKKSDINQANSTYYSTLQQTLNNGYMGTEESIFTIMSYREPHIYDRYELDGNGLIVKFIESLLKDQEVTLAPVPKQKKSITVSQRDLSHIKTNSYILTFNFPDQLLHTINSMKKVPEWIDRPHLVLIDNSTDPIAKERNAKIAQEYNMEYIPMNKNTGICGGRQKAAEHFHESDADYMFFFEDDMTINSIELEGQFCRNGFRKFIPNLYDILHKIIMKENFDFLKVSFTEVYFDNDKALPWYNVPQEIRSRDWPDYDKLPITGLDPNSPPAKYNHIKVLNGVAYITGEVNYCNWPMIVSKKGNKKMFIDTKWAHPFEQTWSSHIHQLTKKGEINSAVLLASPIWHDRILWYKPEERREN